ncbi:similar to Saccharomyces cerevisiae YJL094C KHA1 Putative K+/H+ antiporter with a probable role in intracellular cation homeostasis [Maudiozyma barnettii]|uniref:Similar to Saccharomyces cerevisiae YJL094C KHA1 Putative K+/H+ antiporter with a probable role in intracellular cation homeostasis n=1 Tax=Maudiozyma barnettii TaxID=61262 RepID=A0A8H2ZMC4_9SACH|nr:Kha1p [Kazachstania barnettii]CAB4256957.1 similar to Saccharomyces cerevisiae YJL094C KHA1 Putative K+/H+ antiporter with a probable role in intracellular cation homeostasis [Kazachstania barnettii]CAD1785562.1 similar to Saccharomyces cerevisiae YJL094C KHA1 Putative K+/H+ antiporter with a probable role in intracellular cation homeostasis [Kazachstania barnettii]
MAGQVGGVLSGANPFHYNSSSPLTLFLFQTCLILATCNLLHLFFGKLRQPKVISEVIAGIILGPTVFGQIPNYTETVFPKSSIPGLNLTANLGIILFMFFLGLEVDTAFMKRHMKTALSMGLATLAIPFGFGCLLAIPLYHNYSNKIDSGREVKFTVFMVFIAVSMAVTAFPVLCRILNELRLIKDRAGIVVLGAGIINDILGWVLLALSVILSNSESSPVNTVYILLCTFGWFLVYFYPLKYALRWILIRTHELDRNKPSTFATMSVLFIMFISAYFTDIIGVHAIFGAFIAGLVVPRENHYVVKLTERMEDIPNIVFIPIYFAVAGLNVDLTLLNEGKDWGYIFASIGIAIASKVFSGAIVAKLHGLFYRESLAVGILMSCKGIVEIVVLTVGLNAEIISKKIFAMFILMALVSTFATTPLTQLAYTESYRKELNKTLAKRDTENGIEETTEESELDLKEEHLANTLSSFEDLKSFHVTEVVTVLNTTDAISTSLEFLNYLIYDNTHDQSKFISAQRTRVLSNSSSHSTLRTKTKRLKRFLSKNTTSTIDDNETGLTVIEEDDLGFDFLVPLNVIHLRLLTERTTDLLQSSTLYNEESHFTPNSDSIIGIFDIFSRLGKVPFSSEVIFSTIREKALNIKSSNIKEGNLVLLPLKGALYEYKGSIALNDEKYQNFNHIYSHLLGINELPYNFFNTLTNLNANLAMLISNTSSKMNVNRFSSRYFTLVLPNENFTSSDFLALYIFLLIFYRNRNKQINNKSTIFVNEKNSGLTDTLFTTFQNYEWMNEEYVEIIYVKTEHKTVNGIIGTSFVESIIENNLSIEAKERLEETTFIMAEPYFQSTEPFSDEVKSAILEGANLRFDVLVVHHYTCNIRKDITPTESDKEVGGSAT